VADLAQQLAHVGLDHRAAAVEHRPALLVDDLDAQAVARHVEADLRLHRRKLRARRERFLDLLLQRLEAGHLGALLLGLERLDVEELPLGRDVALLDLPVVRDRSWPPPRTTCDESPAPLPPSSATFRGR
jgi:hypothetical protein